MENNLVVEASVQVTEVEIKDHGVIRGLQCSEKSVVDITSNPLEVYLFCVRQGQLILQASFIPHPLELGGGDAIFLANPRSAWHVKLRAETSTEFYILKMDASVLHHLIMPTFNQGQLGETQHMNMRDLMKIIPVGPSMMNCFDQLLHHKLKPPFSALYEKAKFLEIFSLIMDSSFGQHMDSCPVALSPAIEIKLNKVRKHIIEHVDEAPDPDRLSVLYELPRNTLREGYRFVYGKTIHQFHADHKLETAMEMLNSGEYLVKEVAFKIGYQNPSHFISAFKKKFGFTPKQFFRRETVS